MKTSSRIFVIIFFLIVVSLTPIAAQCPMCKMAAESNMKSGGMAGQGLNQGILYLLALPYLIVGTMIYLYRKNKKVLNQD